MSADRLRPLAALVLLGSLLASGCSDAFDPFVEAEQAFALFGFLDARQDTQFVRVQPIAVLDTNRVEARVMSTALASGEEVVWQDSLIRLDNGRTGIVYFASFRPQPGVRYRVEAAPQEGGVASAAEITVPAEPTLRVVSPSVTSGGVTQELVLDSILRPRDAQVTYTVRQTGGEPIAFSFNYAAQPTVSSGGFEVLVNLLRNAETIQALLGLDPDEPEPVALLDLRLDYDLIDERGGVVTGEVGAFGAAARFDAGWTLSPQVVEAIGFVDAQGEG